MEALDDIHILSIPGFQWFQVDAKSTPPKIFHACAALPGGQIAVSGGMAVEKQYEVQDVWNNSLGIFDMGTLEWSDKYDADKTDYETPRVIQDWYNDG